MKILLVGDSIVASMFLNGASILAAGERTVESIAVSGNTVGDQLAAWTASSQFGNPSVTVAFLQVGINDIRTGLAPATTLTNMASLINSMRTNNPTMKIVLGLMLPARQDNSVNAAYFTKFVPINDAYLAAGTGGSIPAVDNVMTSAYDFFNAGAGFNKPEWFNADGLHPLTGGNQLNAALARDAINIVTGSDPDPVPDGGESRGQYFEVGEWRSTSVAANSNGVLIGRQTGYSTGTQLRRNCRLVNFTVAMQNLGTTATPAAGSSLTLTVIRASYAGYTWPPTTIGAVLAGESNVTRTVNVGADIQFQAGDLLYVAVTTGAGWTATTATPSIKLGLVEN